MEETINLINVGCVETNLAQQFISYKKTRRYCYFSCESETARFRDRFGTRVREWLTHPWTRCIFPGESSRDGDCYLSRITCVSGHVRLWRAAEMHTQCIKTKRQFTQIDLNIGKENVNWSKQTWDKEINKHIKTYLWYNQGKCIQK